MRFTDGKENLEVEIVEGQHGFDTTEEFFDGTSKSDENGVRYVGNVRDLLADTFDRILGNNGYETPCEDTRVWYRITNMRGNVLEEDSKSSSDNPANVYCNGCGCLLTDENDNPCGDYGWCDNCY